MLNLNRKYCEWGKTVRPLLIAFLFFILSFTLYYLYDFVSHSPCSAFFPFTELMQADKRRLTDKLVLIRLLTDLGKLQV